jgi:DNA 3'-phosphatase
MWKKVDTVVYYISPDFKFLPTIAIFSFLGAILKQINLANDKLLYTFNYDMINEKIKLISDKGCSIILFDSFETESVEDIQKAIEIFQEEVKCPIVSFITTKLNKYSKPFTGIWKIIELLYKTKNKYVNKEVSMVIGNKAGISHEKYHKFYCSDRSFASNVGLHFSTPDRFFLGTQTEIQWEWNKLCLDKFQLDKILHRANNIKHPIILDEINKLPISDKYTIIVTGLPICGKTTFIQKLKRKWDAEYNKGTIETNTDNINIDILEQWVVDSLTKNNSIIVELNSILLNLTRIIKKSMELKTPILIVEIKTPLKIQYLLNCLRVQTSKTPDTVLISKYTLDAHNKKCESPLYNIPCIIRIVYPFVLQPIDELWYKYSL